MRHKCLLGRRKSHQELICFFRVIPKGCQNLPCSIRTCPSVTAFKREDKFTIFDLNICLAHASANRGVIPKLDLQVQGLIKQPWKRSESWFSCQFPLLWMFQAIRPQLHLDYIPSHSKWQIIAAPSDIQCNNINHDEFPFTVHVASIHYSS